MRCKKRLTVADKGFVGAKRNCLVWMGLGLVGFMVLDNPAISQGEKMSFENSLEIWYKADNARPMVSTDLHLSKDGKGELFLGTSWSLPQTQTDTVGFFQGSVSPARLASLWHTIRSENLLDLKLEEPPPGLPATIRTLLLKSQQQKNQFVLFQAQTHPALKQLEERLMDIMAELAQKPYQAALVTVAELKQEKDSIQPILNIQNVGKENLTLLLGHAKNTGQLLQVSVLLEQALSLPSGASIFVPWKNEKVPNEQLPSGPTQLAPDRSYRLILPAVSFASSNAPLFFSASVLFWMSEKNGEARPVMVQTPRQPLNRGSASQPNATQEIPGNQRLRLSLESHKKKYSVREKIRLRVALHNEGPNPISVVGRFLVNHHESPDLFRDLTFTVQGPQGYENQTLFRVRAGQAKQHDVLTLPAGAVHSKEIQLTTYHSLHKPGQYVVRAHYNNVAAFPDMQVWQGQLESNPLTLERH